MGDGIRISCRQCEYEESFRLGIGFRYNPQAVFYGGSAQKGKSEPLLASLVKDPAILEKALNLIRDGGRPDTDVRAYGHEVYGCPNCGSLNRGFYFRITAEGDIFEPQYECPKCGHVQTCLHIYNASRIKWPCPSCGKKKLSLSHSLFWD